MFQDKIPQNSNNRNAHEIDYKIFGEEMQFVEIELDPQEGVVAEAGTFMMMDDNIKMNTILGDGSNQETGLLGKIFSAGKRILTGESLFMTVFTNDGFGKKQISFASPYPGKIIPIDLTEFGGKFICQMAKKVLQPGEVLKVDTGCIVGFTQDVDYDIEFVGGIKNTVFGGEGLFFASLKGPGTVYIQSLPFSRLAGRVLSMAPRTGSGKRGEGSVLGGIGDLLDGDNRF